MLDRGQITGARIDGPLAFDNAISRVAAKTKAINSAVAGDSDILVVPDLESGNMLVKQLIYLSGVIAAGIVLGARVPVMLTDQPCVRAPSRTRAMSPAILVVNVGSSSIKFALYRRCRHPGSMNRSTACRGSSSAG